MLVEKIEESYDTSRLLVADPAFKRLGLTDAAIATVSSRGVLVLTTDLQLHVALQERGIDSLNFNRLRPLEWQPRSVCAGRVMRGVSFSLLDRVPDRLLDEFSPDMKRIGKRVWHGTLTGGRSLLTRLR